MRLPAIFAATKAYREAEALAAQGDVARRRGDFDEAIACSSAAAARYLDAGRLYNRLARCWILVSAVSLGVAVVAAIVGMVA